MDHVRTNLSRDFLARLGAMLDTLGVEHSRLSEGPPAMNHSVTDHQHVFIKIATSDEKSHRPTNEIVASAALEHISFPSPRAMLKEVLTAQDDAGLPRQMTVWSYVEQVPPPTLKEQLDACLDLMVLLSDCEVQASNENYDVHRMGGRTVERIEAAGESPVRAFLSPTRAALEKLDLLSWDTRWLHGDLHVRNVLWNRNRKPLLADWEYHGPGPLEWELVQTFRSIFMFAPHLSAAARKPLIQYFASATMQRFPDVQWELFFIALQVRNASSSWYLSQAGYDAERLRSNYELQAMIGEQAFRDLFLKP